MVISHLSTVLPELLAQADELWIAVALATDEGLDFIRSHANPNAIHHYLIGIDMGTPVSVLKTLATAQQNGTRSRIGQSEIGIFHPKLYLFRTQDRFKAVLGSANLTLPGLSKNQELSTMISDPQTCNHLLKWFLDQFKIAFPLTEFNISSYAAYSSNSDGQADSKQRQPPIKLQHATIHLELDDIDFSDRYFKKEHHFAFRKEMWKDTTKAAERERKKTVERFLQLHETIFPRFSEFDLEGLHHNVTNHIVSNHYHTPDRVSQDINAIWLSYGKSQDEIAKYHREFGLPYEPRKEQQDNDFQSFINHARLQIRLELEHIGIWLLFGKNKGSILDRDYFQQQMRKEKYREDFFNMVKGLPNSYRISIDRSTLYINQINSPNELWKHCRQDRPEAYFIIGRDYKITDPEMSEEQLPETTLKEFRLLYPIYKTMRHYF